MEGNKKKCCNQLIRNDPLDAFKAACTIHAALSWFTLDPFLYVLHLVKVIEMLEIHLHVHPGLY